MDANAKYEIHITDGEWGRDITVEADEDGLYLEGGTIPWKWIDSARQTVRLSCEQALVLKSGPDKGGHAP